MTEPVSRPVSIVVLSKFRDVFEPFLESVKKFSKLDSSLVVVADGSEVPNFLHSKDHQVSYILMNGPEKFSMAGNGNIGLKSVPVENDVLYVGDDVRFTEENTVQKLQEIAYKYKEVGILSPKIVGRGSPTQVNPDGELTYCKPLEMWFPCVYIKREVLDKVGFLDDQFSGFGSDDLDYCIRTKLAGFELAVTNVVSVQHEASPEGGPTTFVKSIGVQEWQKQQGEALEKLKDKYQVTRATLANALQSGDCSLLLNKQAPMLVDQNSSKQEQLAFLRSRKLFIATPAYGGMITVSFTNSLLGLINICHDVGIKYTISFIYNESLVTRARNSLVHDFLKTDHTDLLFCDADISFDPRDVVSLLFHPEEVIGAPCPRKNLRIDRAVAAARKSGKEYSIEELEEMCGEIVLNFAPTQTPAAINLGQMQEVQDVGTGLMLIKREVFSKIADKFPQDWYIPMRGEHGDASGNGVAPTYMYFQAGIDPDTAEHNVGGLPHYLSEDYWFCRRAKKAGIGVYVAPWIRTQHAGMYLFKGNLVGIAQSGGKLR
jgi:hypothetical protein